MVKKSLLWVYRTVFLIVSIALIVAAVAAIALRYVVMPHIDEYKDQFAAKISQSIGRKLTISQMTTHWDGFNLQFSLHDVNVYDAENRPALSLSHIETSLSWLSIPLLEPRLASIVIDQPELTIRREKDGVIYVAGISMSGESHPEFANWVLRQSEINVLDAKVLWQDDMRAAPPLTFTKLNLKIVNPAWESLLGQHYFGLTATPSAGSSFPIDIRGEVSGKNVADKNSWHGTLYAKLEGTDIAAWRPWIDYPLELREGYGAAQLWLQFANARAYSITSDIALRDIKSQFSKNSREAVLNQLSGRIRWIQRDDGQEIQAEHIKMQSGEGLNLKNGYVSLREHIIKEKRSLEGSVKLDEMNLADLTLFASYLPLSQDTRNTINGISASGLLKNINVSWNGNGNIPQQYSLHGQFSNIAINTYEDIPGISHLSGSIDANENSGTLNIMAQQTVLDMQFLMREATPIDRLSGQIKWANSHGKNSEIQVKNLAISNAHIAGTVNARYLNKGKGGYLELNGKFGQADAKKAYYYYPKILGENTTHWLKNAIQEGRLENINILVKGDLDDFPFTNNKNGLFRVTAELDHGTLEYSPGWPKIEGMKLDMLFEGKGMELNSKAGHLLGNQITKTKATIPDLTASDPILNITGETQGPVSEGIKYINSSPLSKIMLGFTDDLRTTGSGKLNLELHLPLEHTDDAKIKGSYVVSNGSMASDSIPEMTKLNGKIDFTESVLNAQNVNTWIYGGPAAFSINTNPDHTLKISARGHLTDAGLKQAFPEIYTRYISGETNWYSTISILNKQADIHIHSDLIGMASSLPAPLKKLANEPMPLVIIKKQASSDQEITRINLGNILGAKISRLNQNGVNKFDRGEITVNTSPELPAQSGLSLRGNLDSLNLDDWRNLLEKTSSNRTSNNDIDMNKIDMSVNTLDIFGRRINALKLLAKPSSDGWQLNIQSQEITGDVQWHHDGDGKITARLKNLIVPSASPSPASLSNASTSGINPKNPAQDLIKDTFTYPELDIIADNFEFSQKKFGHMELQAKEQNDNWSIQKLKLITPDNTLNATGDWFTWKRNPNTLMSFQWSINDLGKTAARLGSPDTIKGGEAEISGQLKWAGSPHEFDLARLSGNLQIESKKGQILKIKPGVGRLFSVLSLQNLPRRLTLDFKDVFSKGFTFDRISATVNINRGLMKSDNFKLEGPTARVDMHGETDLQKETQHLYVKVTPYISDSLSLAAFAGGPAVGAAAYIAQKILRDPLNKLAQEEYEIVGTWDNPSEVESADINADNKTP